METFPSPLIENAIRRRVVGRWRLLLLVGIPVFAILFVLITVIVAQIPSDGAARMVVAFVMALVGAACVRAIVRFSTKKMQQAWLARGVPPEMDFTFAIQPEGLQASSEVGASTIRWASINEVMLFRAHWVLITAGHGFGIPRHSFAAEADERTFMTALFDHLEPSARARSQQAEKLLATWRLRPSQTQTRSPCG